MYSIFISDQAFEDLAEIYDFIFSESYSKERAKSAEEKIFTAIHSLSIFPYRFEKYDEKYHRLIVDKKYKIIYKIHEEEKKILIIKIFRSETKN